MKKEFWFALLMGLVIAVLPFITSQSWAETVSSRSLNLQAQVQAVVPDDVQWSPNPDIIGVESAIALGDLSNSELYVLFGKMESGAIFPAHTHPDARITTVISGVMYYGVGKQFDRAVVQPYPAGSVVYTPAGTSHFMWAQDGEAMMQETGFGPTGITFATNTVRLSSKQLLSYLKELRLSC